MNRLDWKLDGYEERMLKIDEEFLAKERTGRTPRWISNSADRWQTGFWRRDLHILTLPTVMWAENVKKC